MLLERQVMILSGEERDSPITHSRVWYRRNKCEVGIPDREAGTEGVEDLLAVEEGQTSPDTGDSRH